MRLFRVLPWVIILALSACDSTSNSDAGEEISCNGITGTWYLTAASCAGTAEPSVPPVAYNFSASQMVITAGIQSCVLTANTTKSEGATPAILSLTGVGNYACSANGANVSTCDDGIFACNNSVSINGVDLSYSSCAVSSGVMTMSRTVSSAVDSIGLSPCNNGQVEQLTLSQTQPPPPTPPTGVTISDANPYDYGTVPVGGVVIHTFTLTNGTSDTITAVGGSGLASPFFFNGGTFPGTGGTCTTTLPAGANCTFVVSFGPVATGVQNDTIDINYNNGSAQVVSRSIVGTGVTPALLTISDGPAYDFGNVQVANSAAHIFTVTNTGGFQATSMVEIGLSAPFAFSGGSYPGAGGNCGITLNPGASCTMEVLFAPAVAGVAADTFFLQYNNGASVSSTSRNIQGTGTP